MQIRLLGHNFVLLYKIRCFTGTDESNSSEVFCEKVTIIPSSGQHETGSSKVKLKNVVDFSWEWRFYTGQLLAVHVGGKYIAYGIKGKSDMFL
jgi:enhancer of mRNA-decapping protein 4